MRVVAHAIVLVAIFGQPLSACGDCGYADAFDVPDDGAIVAVTLTGPDCRKPFTDCDDRYPSGHCEHWVGNAEGHCTLVVTLENGHVETREGDYGRDTGCGPTCTTSTLPYDTLSRIARDYDSDAGAHDGG
jgi:hypothetical protein